MAMRAHGRRRPQRRSVASDLAIDLEAVARSARYVGSQEHKSFPSFAGPPALRSDASKCDPSLASQTQLTRWLRSAIMAGRVSVEWEGNFPKYVWHVEGDTCFEGRLVNRENGDYKGYPLEDTERPYGL